AGEIGHFAPGVMDIRDYIVPEPGFYTAIYSNGYTTDRLNDPKGNKVDSVTINPGGGPGVTLGVDVNVYALAPTLIWVSPCIILGARYGAYIAPTFGNTSVGASAVGGQIGITSVPWNAVLNSITSTSSPPRTV